MANRHRGEIEATLDGRTFRLVLTLGALAELEAAFGDEDMLALATRFEKGRLSARDCLRIIAAGLRGAGYDVGDDAVAAMRCDSGAAGYVAIVGRLLQATFGCGDGTAVAAGGKEAASSSAPVEAGARVPFPGDA